MKGWDVEAFAAVVKDVGRNAVARARAAGTDAYYREDGAIVRERPDGSRQAVEFRDGETVVVRDLPPSARRMAG